MMLNLKNFASLILMILVAGCGGIMSPGGIVTITTSGLENGKSYSISRSGTGFTISSNGATELPPHPYGTNNNYSLVMGTQPTGQVCYIESGDSGPYDAQDRARATVSCRSGYSISGTVTSLPPGASVTLRDSTGVAGSVTVTSAGAFTLPNRVQASAAVNYYVVIDSQTPDDPTMRCSKSQEYGIATDDVTNVTITCN